MVAIPQNLADAAKLIAERTGLSIEIKESDNPISQLWAKARAGQAVTDDEIIEALRPSGLRRHARQHAFDSIRTVLDSVKPEKLPVSWIIVVNGEGRREEKIGLDSENRGNAWATSLCSAVAYAYLGICVNGADLLQEVAVVRSGGQPCRSEMHATAAEVLDNAGVFPEVSSDEAYISQILSEGGFLDQILADSGFERVGVFGGGRGGFGFGIRRPGSGLFD